MHSAYPTRKHTAPKRAPASASAVQRLRPYALPLSVGAALLALLYLLTRRTAGAHTPAGTAPVVLVTTIDPAYGSHYEALIKENREAYAARHGKWYTTFFPDTTSYNLTIPNAGLLPTTKTPPAVPASWAKVPALRHALLLHPHTPWFFYLDHHALLMRHDIPLEAHILRSEALEPLIQPNVPVVPPDSVIRTMPTRSPHGVHLILTQDHDGLSPHAVLLRRGEWARFFLDAWFDPLYRAYNFERAEGHALEHLVQWHGTVLAKLALVPQRVLNAYVKGTGDEKYREGDFVAHVMGCDWPGRSCESEAAALATRVTR